MNNNFLGLDTSNYTTSSAVFSGSEIRQSRRLLPVAEGQKGLRQSDAVFLHTRQIAEVVGGLGSVGNIRAVGASLSPRDAEGSYMPCFLVGANFARSLASLYGIPFHGFSHQAGHIAAALYGAQRLDVLQTEFYAFHVSGGTTEVTLVRPHDEKVILPSVVGATLDASAGQIIDRVGVMLGLPFPCGPALEQLALQSEAKFRPKASVKADGICLSGLQNQCETMLRQGKSACDIALFCLVSIGEALRALTKLALNGNTGATVLYAGGVMSNSILKKMLQTEHTVFAPPQFCTDNAAGIALLTAVTEGAL